ncbi:sugar transferase [uncultured Eubacterium sp.]|uniref:sugar transferase n=1 Tax=uncultured Eubacterium sp. TaxID=165185 RepID=UPI00344A5589
MMNHKHYGLYELVFKRFFDFVLSLLALIVFSPILVTLTIVGAFVMKGNPFFTQDRPGKDEKIFKLIKFRTMTNAKDKDGNLLPDADRNTKYGLFLRNTSLDELPELINILKGDMSVIGPRPLLIEYLPYYNELEKHRHDVRPGLTGWAQVNGRNSISWEERFEYDVQYAANISFTFDLKIFFMTIKKVVFRSDVAEDTNAVEGNFAEIRKKQLSVKAD